MQELSQRIPKHIADDLLPMPEHYALSCVQNCYKKVHKKYFAIWIDVIERTEAYHRRRS